MEYRKRPPHCLPNGKGGFSYPIQCHLWNPGVIGLEDVLKFAVQGLLHAFSSKNWHVLLAAEIEGSDIIQSSHMVFVFMRKNNRVNAFD